MPICKIEYLGKYRNGGPKYWCKTHYCAVETHGALTPTVCTRHDQPQISDDDKYVLNISDWEGGVGIWGSLHPVYDTTTDHNHVAGIHLHARLQENGVKQIDNTFNEIAVATPEIDLFGNIKYITINAEIALAYTASMVLSKEIKCIYCPNCKKPHIDSDYFAITYHKKHMCTYCGKDFIDSEKGISNPIVEIQEIFKCSYRDRIIKFVDKELKINQKDFPGGVQIWGSNPAIIWTANREEEAGIHIHVFKDENGTEAFNDDTYGKVIIDDVILNGDEIRILMVQQSMSHLKGKVNSINCPKCNESHFDKLDHAVIPHEHHLCEFCSSEFTTSTKLIGNPAVEKFIKLQANYYELQK